MRVALTQQVTNHPLFCPFYTACFWVSWGKFVLSKQKTSLTHKNKIMETTGATKITVETVVKAPVEKVWKYWSLPEHITKWCAASDDWHVPKAENDLTVGGKFSTRMEAKDGSFGFDF